MPNDVIDDIDETEDDDLTREDADDSDLVKRLRRQLKTANKRAKTADELEKENRTLKGAQVISQAGLADLTERQRNTLLREVDGDLTPEALRAAAVDLGWAQAEPDPAEAEIDEQKQISNATKGHNPRGGSEITPQEAAKWDKARILQFRKQHPEHFKALMRGESVRGVTF